MLSRYWDDEGGAFFFTAHDHEQLIVRKKMTQDGAVPSGNSVAALGLLKLAKLSGETEFAERGEGVLRSFGDYLGRVPAAFHMMLVALDFHLDSPVEVAIVGERSAENTQAVLRAVDSRFIPNKVWLLSPIHQAQMRMLQYPFSVGNPWWMDKPRYSCVKISHARSRLRTWGRSKKRSRGIESFISPAR